jgi:hypothetical protein
MDPTIAFAWPGVAPSAPNCSNPVSIVAAKGTSEGIGLFYYCASEDQPRSPAMFPWKLG